MKKNWKLCILFVCLLAVIVFCGACGDAGEEDKTKATAEAAPKATPTAEATATAEPTSTPVPTATPPEIPQDLMYTEIKSGEGSMKEFLYVEITDGEEGNGPENLFDGDYETRWAYANTSMNYQLDILFTQTCYIDQVQTTWFTDSRVYYYQLWVDYIDTGGEKLVGDREQNEEPRYTVDMVGGGAVSALYYIFYDNSTNNKWVSIHEIDAVGFSVSSESYTVNEKLHTITIPAETSVEDFLSNLKIDGTFSASLGNEDGTAVSIANGNTLRVTCGTAAAEYLIITEG